MLPSHLSPQTLTNFTTIERVCSALSLFGCAFIAISFLSIKEFQLKPINRLVFYASIGNIFTNVATLMARSAINRPTGGLCQFQAFLIQMFMSADAYWTLAMACNVYLTFYWKFDANKLRRLEIYYIILCYGIPFIPAFVYIFTKTPSKGRMYGNATLWCWIGGNWDAFRIATFYGPIWVVILLTTAIYVRAGREIYAKRKSLRNFDAPPVEPLPLLSDPFTSVKVTEVHVTSEAAVYPASSDSIDLVQLNQSDSNRNRVIQQPPNAYTVTVSTSNTPFEKPTQEASPDRFAYTENKLDRKNTNASRPSNTPKTPIAPLSAYMPNSERSRLYPMRRHAAHAADNAAWSYTKVSVLFFMAMMITWIPSSANRLYSVVKPGQVSLGLSYSAAFVLPLQGFWNALIYSTTSLQACEALWDRVRYGKRSSIHETLSESDSRENRSNKMYMETDSMTELQCSRPNTISSDQ